MTAVPPFPGSQVAGIGIDVCSIDRWREMITRRPEAARRVLTDEEAALSPASQAARFAAKEALAKALGSPGGLNWHDTTIARTPAGQPYFVLTGTVAARAQELGISVVHLSLSHDGGLATALVVCERG